MKRLVLAGGGHAHLEVLRNLAQLPGERWEITLVTPFPWFTYSGMIPGHLAGHYELDDCTVDLVALAARANATVVLSTVARVNADANTVACASGAILPYDVLSLDVGSISAFGKARGIERHAIAMRPLEKMVKGWNDVLVRARDGRMAAVTVVGGGAAGVELALAMNHRFRRDLFEVATHVRLVADSPSIVPAMPAGASARLRRRMKRDRVEMQVGAAVTEVGPDFIRLASGLEFATDAVFWATGAAAPAWIRESGFATDGQGFLLTNEMLQSPSHPNVFGAGDCINELGHSLPRSGVFAVRAGPALAANLRAALEGKPLAPHLPKSRYLALVSTGGMHAVGAYGGLSFDGKWAWRWKDHIDRGFIARYRGAALPR